MTTREYVIGSAADPDELNRWTRNDIERRLRMKLCLAGVSQHIAVEAASEIVGAYLTTQNLAAMTVVSKLAPTKVKPLIALREKNTKP